ncbi:dolichyl-phosphate beta-glucosyltransferase [Fodinicola feengrottensis]|uniref:dolichyl-phosphate beta-glucosyltransferase n=1 Tax=Fodinicola feengrottensis TaxID=435914 RepID=A0ABN2G6I9_9ACTN|nr:glycosyltransferase family 2 protein [Fodinicola feengrottensis]
MHSPTPANQPVSAQPPVQAQVIDLSVIIPAYNEQDRLGTSLAAVHRHLNASGVAWEVIVADDGSTDGTAALVERLTSTDPRVKVLRADQNKGKGDAVRRGILASHGKRVLYCDADLATPIEEIAVLRAELDSGFDAAIGSRAGQQALIEVSQRRVRVWLGRLGNRLIQLLAVPGIADTQCGFKMFDGDKARQVFALSVIDGWGFDVEILRLFRQFGWTISEVPVRWAHQPGSKVRPLDYLRVLMDVVRVRLAHRGKKL